MGGRVSTSLKPTELQYQLCSRPSHLESFAQPLFRSTLSPTSHTMSTSSDLTLLQSSLSTLLRPLPPSHSLPASLAQAQQTLLQRDLKLRLSAGGMRKCVQQLEGLREVEVRKRERKRTREAEGRVSVQRSEGWVQGMPKRWPGPEEGEREER